MKLDNPKARVGTDEINGTEVEVHLYKEQWRIVLDDETLGRGETYVEAKAMARRELKKREVKVAVAFLDSRHVRRLATGFHRSIGDRRALDRVLSEPLPPSLVVGYPALRTRASPGDL